MSTLQEMQAAIALAAQTGPDMNVATKGGGGRLLPAGYAFGRMISYVEFGNQPQEFKGQAKDPKPVIQLGFALWGQGYQEEDGSPSTIFPYSFSMDRNEKAKAYLLFKSMNWKGDKTHFAQFLNEPFLVKIVHEPKSKADQTIVSRVDLKGFLPPLDPVTRQPYAIPEAPAELFQLFLWDHPTQAAWDSLFIEGNWEDGRSKNYIQDTIIGATNFSGSALEAMLGPQTTHMSPATPTMPVVPTVGAVGTVPLVAPVVPLSTAAPASVGAPVSSVIPATTSPSSPALPALPVIPGI